MLTIPDGAVQFVQFVLFAIGAAILIKVFIDTILTPPAPEPPPGSFLIEPDLAVHDQLPDGMFEFKYADKGAPLMAYGSERITRGKWRKATFTHCDECGGWVDGAPHQTPPSAYAPTHDAKQVRLFYCRRCGSQIGKTRLKS